MTERQLHLRVRLIVAAAAALAFVLLLFIILQCAAITSLNAKAAENIARKEELVRQMEQTEEEIERITQREYIERYAREKYGYGYKGEKRYIISGGK
jgi:cell division protein FtsB